MAIALHWLGSDIMSMFCFLEICVKSSELSSFVRSIQHPRFLKEHSLILVWVKNNWEIWEKMTELLLREKNLGELIVCVGDN